MSLVAGFAAPQITPFSQRLMLIMGRQYGRVRPVDDGFFAQVNFMNKDL